MSKADTPPPYRYQAIETNETVDHGDVKPDDITIGVTEEQSAPEIRAMFVRKVYSVLFFQVLGSCIVASGMYATSVTSWVMKNPWFMILTLI